MVRKSEGGIIMGGRGLEPNSLAEGRVFKCTFDGE